jgi:hypothetical protein
MFLATSVIFEKQSKYLPKRRKFALSGHPVSEEETALLAFYELRMNFQNANLAKSGGRC